MSKKSRSVEGKVDVAVEVDPNYQSSKSRRSTSLINSLALFTYANNHRNIK